MPGDDSSIQCLIFRPVSPLLKFFTFNQANGHFRTLFHVDCVVTHQFHLVTSNVTAPINNCISLGEECMLVKQQKKNTAQLGPVSEQKVPFCGELYSHWSGSM